MMLVGTVEMGKTTMMVVVGTVVLVLRGTPMYSSMSCSGHCGCVPAPSLNVEFGCGFCFSGPKVLKYSANVVQAILTQNPERQLPCSRMMSKKRPTSKGQVRDA